MTNVSTRAWTAGCTVATTALLLASCTSGSGDHTASDSTSTPARSTSPTATKASEKDLTQQAQAALADLRSGKLVEAGAERVTDGIHTEPTLSKGKTYLLALTCFGTGSARMAFTPADTGTDTTVPCDQTVVRQRITVDKPLRLDVDGTTGSTGVIAWQIGSI
ncbi:hypothetical protein [Streptomyces sp. NPDC001815]|uniref:hypothetical protein n=1 Tax=Streptomyces sp. NPDC001815 TaxID=3154526 RepID=UPI0033331341